MITGGDLRQSRLDVGYKTFTISPCPITDIISLLLRVMVRSVERKSEVYSGEVGCKEMSNPEPM